MKRHQRPLVRQRSGFSLVELLLSLFIALVVISSATAFTVSSWQARRNWTIRETVDRSARFVGMALARDAQEAGVALESSPVFASVDARGDTLSILYVPYEPDEALVHPIWDDGDEDPFYPALGNCGNYCFRFNRNGGEYDVAPGDIALLQVGSERRLWYLTSVQSDGASRFRVVLQQRDRMLGRPAGLSDSIRLPRSGATLQKLRATVYWRDADTETLYRAQEFDASGNPVGVAIADNVEVFNVRLQFMNGSEGSYYNGLDADTTNDGNRIMGVRVEAVIRSDQTDPAVNNGLPVRRSYEWRVSPRNLLYEKNRQ